MSAIQRALALLERERCVAILRTGVATAVIPALEAAMQGGFRILECTLNTPGALKAILQMRKATANDPDFAIGAGTVLSLEDAKAAQDAGAQFLVSPVCDVEVIQWACQQDLLCLPGTATPTEMWRAHCAGAVAVKLFPAISPDYLRACLGPMPMLKIVPTAGVTFDNAAAFLAAGATAVGFGNVLFDPALIGASDFAGLTERARRFRALAAPSSAHANRAR